VRALTHQCHCACDGFRIQQQAETAQPWVCLHLAIGAARRHHRDRAQLAIDDEERGALASQARNRRGEDVLHGCTQVRLERDLLRERDEELQLWRQRNHGSQQQNATRETLPRRNVPRTKSSDGAALAVSECDGLHAFRRLETMRDAATTPTPIPTANALDALMATAKPGTCRKGDQCRSSSSGRRRGMKRLFGGGSKAVAALPVDASGGVRSPVAPDPSMPDAATVEGLFSSLLERRGLPAQVQAGMRALELSKKWQMIQADRQQQVRCAAAGTSRCRVARRFWDECDAQQFAVAASPRSRWFNRRQKDRRHLALSSCPCAEPLAASPRWSR
jgi:hypothetical protein